MPSPNNDKLSPVLPGSPGFSRMSAADFNAHLLANPPGSGRLAAKAKSGKRASPEEDLHRLVFAWIFAMQPSHPVLAYMMHVPNGGARSKGEAGKLKAMGVRRGVADVISPFAGFAGSPWTGFACELKAPKGRCSAEQVDFLEKAKSQGWLTGVCFTLDQFIFMAQTYLGQSVGTLVAVTAVKV